jgi:hypothetical protein
MSDRHAATDNELATYLKNNPRMMGVLTTILLLLTSAGNAAAANSGTIG